VTCPIIFLLQQETQQNKTIENLISRISILLLKNWNVFMDMSKCLVKENINPYHNPRMIFSSSCDCVFFEKPIRDFYVLRVTRNAFHLMMGCCHNTLLCITNRHVFCLLLSSKYEKMRPVDFSLQIFYILCAISYKWLSD